MNKNESDHRLMRKGIRFQVSVLSLQLTGPLAALGMTGEWVYTPCPSVALKNLTQLLVKL